MTTTILFVDDNLAPKHVAAQYLGRMRPQWQVLLSYSLAEARRLYINHFPDAVVLDIDHPNGKSLDLMGEFKHNRPSLPIIIISGDNSMSLRQNINEHMKYSFLIKPFTPLLLNYIESAISTSKDEWQEPIIRNRITPDKLLYQRPKVLGKNLIPWPYKSKGAIA